MISQEYKWDTLLCDKDRLVTQASPRDDVQVHKMETININHRHVLGALCPLKGWTNRGKKAGGKAVLCKQHESKQTHIHNHALALFFLSSSQQLSRYLLFHRDLRKEKERVVLGKQGQLWRIGEELWCGSLLSLLQRPHVRTGLYKLMFVYILLGNQKTKLKPSP